MNLSLQLFIFFLLIVFNEVLKKLIYRLEGSVCWLSSPPLNKFTFLMTWFTIYAYVNVCIGIVEATINTLTSILIKMIIFGIRIVLRILLRWFVEKVRYFHFRFELVDIDGLFRASVTDRLSMPIDAPISINVLTHIWIAIWLFFLFRSFLCFPFVNCIMRKWFTSLIGITYAYILLILIMIVLSSHFFYFNNLISTQLWNYNSWLLILLASHSSVNFSFNFKIINNG